MLPFAQQCTADATAISNSKQDDRYSFRACGPRSFAEPELSWQDIVLQYSLPRPRSHLQHTFLLDKLQDFGLFMYCRLKGQRLAVRCMQDKGTSCRICARKRVEFSGRPGAALDKRQAPCLKATMCLCMFWRDWRTIK